MTEEFGLADLRVVISRAALYIGGDSGPLHLAATTRTPIVAIYGPTLRAFASLDCDGQCKLHADLEDMFATHNRSKDGGTEVEAEYLEVIAIRN